ncbi:MAG TPA: AsmA family protein [Verrucomicrobiota bacterium]|nr:AsmA family protein [Verrucomicrobiota bacterium]
MMTEMQPGSTSRKPRRWLRALAWGGGLLAALLLLVYFIATSSGFFTRVILPRVSRAMNAQITVRKAEIRPFRQVVLHDLKVQTTGAEPLATVAEARLRYHLLAILGGNFRVDELTLASPTITVVENPDGTSNLDPLWATPAAPPVEKSPPPAPAPARPLRVDLKQLALRDATFRQVKNHAQGPPDLLELARVNVTVEDLKNGQPGRLTLAGDLRLTGSNALLHAQLEGRYDFALAADLQPASLKGSARLDVRRAENALAGFAGVHGALDAEVTPTEVKEAALRIHKNDVSLGELRANGPLALEALEGRLDLSLTGIDHQLLNLFGAPHGLDFGPTTLRSTHQIELSRGGTNITARGQVEVSRFQVTRAGQTTPQFDLHQEYDLTLDFGQKTALARQLALTGTQNGRPLLQGDLTHPMPLSWGDTHSSLGDSTFSFTLTDLNLADWKPFLDEVATAGRVTARAQILSQQGGRQITFNLDSQIDHLATQVGGQPLAEAAVTLQASGQATDLNQFNLASFKLEIAHRNQMLAAASGSGVCDLAAETADLKLAARAMLAPLLQALPQPEINLASGTLELNARLARQPQSQTLAGQATLADLTAQWGENAVRHLGARADFDVGLTPREIQVRQLAGTLTQDARDGGRFDLAAKYHREKETVELTARLTDFNQHGAGPFLEPLLANQKLVSVDINAQATAQYDPRGASAVKADLQVANLVVADPKQPAPGAPLAATMRLDASARQQKAEVRQFQLALTPTARATNQLQLTGWVDWSRTNALQGDLKLTAEALDLTRYYDLFMADTPAAARETPAAPDASAPAAASPEPEALTLPFHHFTAHAAISRLYLRELEIADAQATVRIDGGRVVVNPCQLTLNGAPADATADLDLGVPGWKYALAFNAQALPLPPLINSFQPDLKGQLSGTASAQGNLNGTGFTGASLQKHLAGQFDMTLTNLNFALVSLEGKTWYTRVLKTVVNVIGTLPELAQNPAGTVLSLLTGKGSASGGGAPELKQSRLEAVALRAAAGGGRVDVQNATLQGSAFAAQAAGTIQLAEVLTNSPLHLPVAISLERTLAQRLGLAGDTPTNAVYARLPDFLTVQGTLGNSKASVNKAALLGGVLQAVDSRKSPPAAGGDTNSPAAPRQPGLDLGRLLQGRGARPDPGAPAATNAPATNPAPVNELLRGLFGPDKK